MNIDVLITGVTGFVGRFVLLDFLEKKPETKIGVIIRPTATHTPTERFYEEIIRDTMFSKFHTQLAKVNIISASLEDIEKTSLIIQSASCIIHCAANVKHYDPYEKLLKDNVNNVRVILRLAEILQCKKLILLSTCYVHPKNKSTRDAITDEIIKLLNKYAGPIGEYTDPVQARTEVANRTQSYRYSKLMGLRLLDCLHTSGKGDEIMKAFYYYAGSQTDKSSVHVKLMD